MEYITKTTKETRDIGSSFAKRFKGGDIVLLQGDLGAGKTTLVQGIADGLGISQKINSPTFTLFNHFSLPSDSQFHDIKTVIHVDAYRIAQEQELVDIGIEDYLGDPHTLTIIEWPEKIPTLLGRYACIYIKILHGSHPEQRHINIED